ncbi:ABC transporter substrate-binding protein [Marvinbryantia formatexigens]|nr:ABC transporter substrate-binding protein [Marvinbryantia formatexigens]UWO23250.1 ABC transporter substrate-binding protein [Marvinbryantia formatexigens DSM 14469]SDG61011.1 raffinose/stachyose/melibiose transport system substrate-binding protein [Marvinbryantia formatexigens]
MKKKLISMLLASAMVAGMTAGVAAEDAAADYSGVTLTFWSMWNSTEPQGQIIQEAADAFSEQTGATINIEWKGRDINTLIQSSLEAGENIDIFEDDYSRISKIYKDYCYDLTEMAEAAGYADQSFACFNEVATEWAGFLPCITEQPQVGGIFYNKDIFDACGITEVPATWEDFLAACQTMVDNGYQPLALDSTYADFTFAYHLDRYLGEAGVSDLAVNGGWSDNESAVKAAQDIIDFINAGYLADGAPDEYPSSQNKIGLTGQVAMVVCANYVCAEVNNNTGSEINWGMFNYPSVEGGADPSNAYAGANSLAITSYSENPQAAFDFLMFLTSGEYDQKMADTASQIPADPSNTAPAIMDGTIEALNATENPLSWNMGLNDNSDLKAAIKDVIIQLYEGKFATGEEFTAAVDALY